MRQDVLLGVERPLCMPSGLHAHAGLLVLRWGHLAPESPEFRWGRRGEPGPCVATCPGWPLPLSVRRSAPERFPGICKLSIRLYFITYQYNDRWVWAPPRHLRLIKHRNTSRTARPSLERRPDRGKGACAAPVLHGAGGARGRARAVSYPRRQRNATPRPTGRSLFEARG